MPSLHRWLHDIFSSLAISAVASFSHKISKGGYGKLSIKPSALHVDLDFP